MKRFLFFLAALLLSLLPMNATVPMLEDGEDGEPEEIIIINENNGEDPTVLQGVRVSAYKTTTTVVILLNNYHGVASVVLTGLGGIIASNQNYITGSGIIMLDISSLPAGGYNLSIFAAHVYQGGFSI